MSLKDAVNEAAKTAKTSDSNSSGRTPQFYNKQKASFINEMCASPVVETRLDAAASEHIPTGNLKAMLRVELDKEVLSALTTNPRMPIKSLQAFVDDESRRDIFSEDDEAFQIIVERLSAEEEEPAASVVEETDDAVA